MNSPTFLLCPKLSSPRSEPPKAQGWSLLGMKSVGIPSLHGFLNTEFFDSSNLCLPMTPTPGKGGGLPGQHVDMGYPALGAWFSRHQPLHDSVSPGGSSRTCLTMHLTKSPTSSSWSKFWAGPASPPFPSCGPTYPLLTPCFLTLSGRKWGWTCFSQSRCRKT